MLDETTMKRGKKVAKFEKMLLTRWKQNVNITTRCFQCVIGKLLRFSGYGDMPL